MWSPPGEANPDQAASPTPTNQPVSSPMPAPSPLTMQSSPQLADKVKEPYGPAPIRISLKFVASIRRFTGYCMLDQSSFLECDLDKDWEFRM